jgi:multicomponent Na+:H+ antiporter subunit G
MSMVTAILSMVLAAFGALLILVAGIGIVRLPDVLTRMHASSKAGTLGAVCILLAVALRFGDFVITVKTVLIVLFLFLTAPVAAHMIGRAGYRSGAPLADETAFDEYASRGEAGSTAAADRGGHRTQRD